MTPKIALRTFKRFTDHSFWSCAWFACWKGWQIVTNYCWLWTAVSLCRSLYSCIAFLYRFLFECEQTTANRQLWTFTASLSSFGWLFHSLQRSKSKLWILLNKNNQLELIDARRPYGADGRSVTQTFCTSRSFRSGSFRIVRMRRAHQLENLFLMTIRKVVQDRSDYQYSTMSTGNAIYCSWKIYHPHSWDRIESTSLTMPLTQH